MTATEDMARAIAAARNACRRDLLSRFRLVNEVNHGQPPSTTVFSP